MTSNDAEIDVLMRRFAGNARSDAMPEHLDADELNAFAEGLLPQAARMRYVSHLADCDNCRQLASQLAMSAGALAKAEPVGSIKPEPTSWSQTLAAFFAPRTLRYAAFAVVLIAAAGVVFLVTRRQNETALVARNEQANQTSVLADKQTEATAQPSVSSGTLSDSTRPEAVSPAAQPSVERERDESKVAGNTPPPKPPAETTAPTTSTMEAEKRAEPSMSKAPSYSPPPPGEGKQVESRSRQQQTVGGISGPRQQQTQTGSISGPQKTDSSADKYQTRDQAQTTTAARERQATDDSNRAAMNQPAPSNRRATEEKRSGPSRNMDNIATTGRNTTNELRVEEPKKGNADAAKSKEEVPETRSVGGRKFQRQGNGWVDVKFKSSMSVRNVSRGSEEFGALDSGLRSIAQQLGGEIIVVWKSKAYRIR
jgi:hypothetical protein